MGNKGILTRLLAIAGTVTVWLPLVVPVLLALVLLVNSGVFRLDYLMPAELFPVAFVGGALLLWAALRARSNRWLIGSGLAIAAVMLVGGQAFAMATGMAYGRNPPAAWWLATVLATLAMYAAALVAMGVGGVRLLRALFRKAGQPAGA
jgi:hypothetical protein